MDLSVGTGPIAPVGSRTQWEIGGPAPVGATEVRAPVGITEWEPADLTVTVGAGTPFTELDAELAERGQEVPLDPVETRATVGGILACGLSGPRRLRLGPVRDHVLQVWIRTADGRLVRGGGPTVKNVTGYDLPRLAVGSFGTLGLIERVTLRCRPRPASSAWFATANGAACYRPSARLTEGEGESVLLEGLAVDIEDQARALRLRPIPGPPDRPRGHHVGRISVAPEVVGSVLGALPPTVRRRAELGVGTVTVAADSVDAFGTARAVARRFGGWMLRELGGASDDDGFGVPLPVGAIAARVRGAFDPDRRMNPGRLPFVEPVGAQAS